MRLTIILIIRLKFPGEFQTKVVSQEDSFGYETPEPNTDVCCYFAILQLTYNTIY
jgi:hypothetical protein